jgi:hypothetical protein
MVRSKRSSREGRPAIMTAVRRELDAILAIIERNTERISRLEDVFALHAKQREEVSRLLSEVRADLRKLRSR